MSQNVATTAMLFKRIRQFYKYLDYFCNKLLKIDQTGNAGCTKKLSQENLVNIVPRYGDLYDLLSSRLGSILLNLMDVNDSEYAF